MTLSLTFLGPDLVKANASRAASGFPPKGERYMGSLPIEHWLIIIVVVVAIGFTIYRAL